MLPLLVFYLLESNSDQFCGMSICILMAEYTEPQKD